MRIVAPLLALTMLACSSHGASEASDDDVRIKVRLESQDTHLYGVTAVDLDLKRDNVVVRDGLEAPAGHALEFPAEVVVKVPIGPGPLVVTATPRGSDGQALGAGEGEVMAVAGSIASVTVPLLSERNRPSRGRMTGPDGGAEPDAALIPDASPEPDALEPDGPATCEAQSRRLPAVAVASVDYGSTPRDREDDMVSVSTGFSHEHIHAFVGWMRFDLGGIPAGARLVAARLSLTLVRAPTGTPNLLVLYSATDSWDPAQLTSDTAEQVERTDQVSDPLGPPRPARALYGLDPERYRPFFAKDLADHAVTLGMFSATEPSAPEAWADFYGLEPQQLAPVLELETCE